MSANLTKGSDWTVEGNSVAGRGEGRTQFRGLQADLNLFGDKLGYERVKTDGMIGPATVAAVTAVIDATKAANSTVTVPPHATKEDIAEHAPAIRGFLLAFSLGALAVSPFKRFEKGTGKDWNTKDQIAYGAGPVHDEFKGLQTELNRFSDKVGFSALGVDGFIGPKTAEAVTKVYNAVVAKNPLLVATPFPPPDTKEEAAEYAAFIRSWLKTTAAKTLLAEA